MARSTARGRRRLSPPTTIRRKPLRLFRILPGRIPRKAKPLLLLLTAHPTSTSSNCRTHPRNTRELFFSVADHFAPDGALIDAGQPFFHCRCEQRNVWDFAEIFGDEPDRLFRGHPVQMIEPRQIHRPRISSQGPFAAQVEINIEITNG